MAQLSLWERIKKQPVGLPDPTKETTEHLEAATASANWELTEFMSQMRQSMSTVNVLRYQVSGRNAKLKGC